MHTDPERLHDNAPRAPLRGCRCECSVCLERFVNPRCVRSASCRRARHPRASLLQPDRDARGWTSALVARMATPGARVQGQTEPRGVANEAGCGVNVAKAPLEMMRAPCERCGHPYGERVAYRFRNGMLAVRHQCGSCRMLAGGDLPGGRAYAPTLRLARDRSSEAPRCERCGAAEGTERHHWAPASVFAEDAGSWPMSYLCRACHQEWHRRTGLGWIERAARTSA